jgi:hypothetical protein
MTQNKLNPENHNELINEYELGYEKLLNKVHDIKDERIISFKQNNEDWSIKEIIIHIADVDFHGYIRIRTAIAEPGKTILTFDQEAWGKELEYNIHSITHALEAVKVIRATNAKLLRTIQKEKWQNTIIHPERGVMNVQQIVEYFTNHLLSHLFKIDERIDQFRKSSRK